MEGRALEASTGNSTLDEIAVASGAASPERIVEWAVLLGIAVVFTSLRTYARARISGIRKLSWDDFLVWLAVVAFAVLIVDVFIISVTAEGLSNDGLSDDRRAALAADPDSQEAKLRHLGSKAQVAKWLLYGLVLWLLKGSLLHFFAGRLTGGIPGSKARAWMSALILLVTYAGTIAAVLLGCHPFDKYWQIFPNPGSMCMPAISPILIAVFLSCNIFTDLYLVSMPIPVLLRAPLRKTQKVSLISLFGCNVLVTAIAVVRAILMLKDPWINGDGMWAIRETFVAICTTNMPPIVPLLRVWLSPCLGRTEYPADDDGDGDNGEKASRKSRYYSNITKRSASRASRKSQVLHNKTMSDRYFADLEAPDHRLAGPGEQDDISLQTYALSRGGEDEAPAKTSKSSSEKSIGYAVTTGEERAATPEQSPERLRGNDKNRARQRELVDESVVQTTREIV